MRNFKTTALTFIIAISFGTLVYAADATTKRLDINTATEAQLQALPGVGSEGAKKIVAGRPYAKKEELKTKNIMSAGSYEKIKKLIDSIC